VKPRIVDEAVDKSRIWKLTEISESSQCRSLKLPDSLSSMRVLLDTKIVYIQSFLGHVVKAMHKLVLYFHQ